MKRETRSPFVAFHRIVTVPLTFKSRSAMYKLHGFCQSGNTFKVAFLLRALNQAWEPKFDRLHEWNDSHR